MGLLLRNVYSFSMGFARSFYLNRDSNVQFY